MASDSFNASTVSSTLIPINHVLIPIGIFLHSECTASRRGQTDIDFTITLPVDEVGAITSSQTSLSATTFVSNIEVAKTQAMSSGAVSQAQPDPGQTPVLTFNHLYSDFVLSPQKTRHNTIPNPVFKSAPDLGLTLPLPLHEPSPYLRL